MVRIWVASLHQKSSSVFSTLEFFVLLVRETHKCGWIRTATATTAACGRNREELLGLRPAGCACRPRHEAAAGSRDPGSFSARLAQSTRAHQKASTYTSTRYPCSSCFRFSVCIRNFNCWTFFLHFDMLFLLYPFHLCTVNVKAKDQSCKAFWLNNSGLFCWSLCNSPFCLSIILQRCTLSHGGGC